MDSTITTTRMNRQPSPSQGRKARTQKGLTRTALCLAGLALTLLPLPAQAFPTLVPTGLGPGDMYHLAFVTASPGFTGSDLTSTDITTYDALVQARADAAGIGVSEGIKWLAIVSTPGTTTNAIDHVGIMGPVYRLDDTIIANNETDLFDGSLINPLSVTPIGNTKDTAVWTGSLFSPVLPTRASNWVTWPPS